MHVPGQLTITSFMQTETCVICKQEYKANSHGGVSSNNISENNKRRLEKALSRGRVCEQCLSKPELALTILQYRLQRYSNTATEYSRVCSNCSKHKQHVVVPMLPYLNETSDGDTFPISCRANDPYAHVFKNGGKDGSTNSSSSNRTANQALDIENCLSLDCALFYEKCKIKNKHDEIAEIMSCAEEAVALL